MRHFEKQAITVDELVGITCDICLTHYDDPIEMQNCTHLFKFGSYNSIFDDGARIECDICQYCLKDKFGQWLHVTKPTNHR